MCLWACCRSDCASLIWCFSSSWLNVRFLFKEAVLIAFFRRSYGAQHMIVYSRDQLLSYKPAAPSIPRVYVKSVCLHSVCGGHAVHVLRPYTCRSRERMPVLRPLPLPHPTSLIVSTPVSSNLPLLMHTPFGIDLLYWPMFCRAMTWMYLLWLSLGTRKMMIWRCGWYDLLATEFSTLHDLVVQLDYGNSVVAVLSFCIRTAFLPRDCHSASHRLLLRWLELLCHTLVCRHCHLPSWWRCCQHSVLHWADCYTRAVS